MIEKFSWNDSLSENDREKKKPFEYLINVQNVGNAEQSMYTCTNQI